MIKILKELQKKKGTTVTLQNTLKVTQKKWIIQTINSLHLLNKGESFSNESYNPNSIQPNYSKNVDNKGI